MERGLRDLSVWLWRYRENERNYPGLHFTGKAEACATLRDLVLRLAGEGGGHRTVPLRELQPEDEAKVSGGQRFVSFAKMRLEIVPPGDELRFMHVGYAGRAATVTVATTYTSELIAGLADVERGRGDWAMYPPNDKASHKLLGSRDRQSVELWFWPCFGHEQPRP